MAWMTEKELSLFKRCGRGVKISTETTIFGAKNIEIGDNVRIDAQTVILASTGPLKIGGHVHLAVGCVLAAGGGITIGDFAAISFRSILISASDDASGEYLVGPQFPDYLRKVTKQPITISDYAFLGAGAYVLPGGVVGQGSMLGCNSVLLAGVTLPPWGIYVGSPARWVKARSQTQVKKSIEMMEYWQHSAE